MYVQYAVIEGTWLAFKYMSTKNGGKGGTIINVSSMGGQCLIIYAYNIMLPSPPPRPASLYNTIILFEHAKFGNYMSLVQRHTLCT